jgi:hypothetical protein
VDGQLRFFCLNSTGNNLLPGGKMRGMKGEKAGFEAEGRLAGFLPLQIEHAKIK